ncbi:carbohydrate ABC transporter permease [Clostridiales bacterium COT073_COT-073]|nr:carbohydrate ABC transporter permease [Clostridiales bacterium COT073_COT-073]
MKVKKFIWQILRMILLILILGFLLFPIFWVLLTSFKSNMEAYRYPPTFWPEQFTIRSYLDLYQKNNEFFMYYRNNFIVSGTTAALACFIAIFGGYALSRFHFKWNMVILAIFTSAQMFPVISRLISLYKIMKDVRLLNTLTGLIWALTAAILPFSIMLMSSFFDAVPKEVEESARIDGASRLGILFKVVMPLVKPGILAVGIYAFLMTWDDYLHSTTLIQKDELRTLSAGVALRYLGELSYDWSLINTISIVGTLPMIFLFFFFQRYMVSGLVAGAVKG